MNILSLLTEAPEGCRSDEGQSSPHREQTQLSENTIYHPLSLSGDINALKTKSINKRKQTGDGPSQGSQTHHWGTSTATNPMWIQMNVCSASVWAVSGSRGHVTEGLWADTSGCSQRVEAQRRDDLLGTDDCQFKHRRWLEMICAVTERLHSAQRAELKH